MVTIAKPICKTNIIDLIHIVVECNVPARYKIHYFRDSLSKQSTALIHVPTTTHNNQEIQKTKTNHNTNKMALTKTTYKNLTVTAV